MIGRNKKLFLGIGVLLLLVLAWNLFVLSREQALAKMAEPFFAACQLPQGCIVAPAGWHNEQNGVYSQSAYEYSAKGDSFTLRQHLAISVWLVAEGGKRNPVRTHRVVD